MIPLIFSLLLFLSVAGSHAAASSPLGEWITADDEAKVEIYKCDDRLCGRIVWLKEPNYTDEKEGGVGTAVLDKKNPDPALRHRPILGLVIMKGFREEEGQTWSGGTVYDPENGKTYRGTLHLVAPDRLELRGYVGIPLFGRTSVWRR